MPKLLGIALSLGFVICLIFLFGFSWYAVSLREQLTECSNASRDHDRAAFHIGWGDGLEDAPQAAGSDRAAGSLQ